jgi:light-regulated signal transduction histidine kinase (bacteriophytochrome)
VKVPILDDNGEPEYLLGISADITDRRRADGELRASKDATEVAHRELEAFSYSVAHDLRSPLRSIDGFSQVLFDDHGVALGEEGKEHLTRVRKAAHRMGELIDDLLALARVSRTDVTRAPIDVSAIARDVGETVKPSVGPAVELVVTEGMTAEADPRLVRVLLENLLSNAFKFSSRREHPRVEIGARTSGGVEQLFVRDNGAGFDVASARKLFTAFQRFHGPSEFEGTGIGLATAERIVSRHGGRIWAESAPDKGATFYFTLTRGDATDGNVASTHDPAPQSTPRAAEA